MSRKLNYVLSFGFLFVFGFAGSWMIEKSSSPKEQERILASIKYRSTVGIEKHLMPVSVIILTPDNIPDSSTDIVELKALIRTRFSNFTQINYQWKLPDTVELISGYTTGDIVQPEAQKDYEVTLMIKGFDKSERKEISLVATILDTQGKKLGNAAVITSRPEDSFEHIAPEVMVRAEEFKASQNKERMPASTDDEK